jgi:tetratricopeptide (TPR) repeat protein
MFPRLAALLPVLLSPALGSETLWNAARQGNIEVYSHKSAEDARGALVWLEQLRSIVQKYLGLDVPDDRPVLVFAFQSRNEYEPYRLRATSDAYYVGTDDRDYIVLPALGSRGLATAAHEYAHLVSHAAGARVPAWLGEGLADVFSTIRFSKSGVQLGGEPFERLTTLRYRRWLPLDTLLSLEADAPLRNTRAGSDIFYAESWALTEMLLTSPKYAPRCSRLVGALAKGPASSADVLEATYGKPLTTIARDLETWVRHYRSKPMRLEPIPAPSVEAPQIRTGIADSAVQAMLATMLLAVGDLKSAESMYRRVAEEAPEDPTALAGLAAIGLAQGRMDESRGLFAKALAGGLANPDLCYRYAHLLDRAGGPVAERRAALERAVALQPGFDDARYALALLEKNLGNDGAALVQLRAMHNIPAARAYHYWMAMADALIGAGQNEKAVAAANKAAELASDMEQRAHATELRHTAQTHLAVRFVRDAAGRLQLVTARAPNDGTEWNPFIEPTDDIRRLEGKLEEIDCSGPAIRVVVDTGGGRVTVAIPDPSHVQMRNAPTELVCGPQSPAEVSIQYAAGSGIPGADGIARGVEFR